MSLMNKAKAMTGKATGRARELTDQAARRVNEEMGGDDLIASTIVRVAEKRERVNKMLEERGCAWRVTGIEVENSLPPKANFILSMVEDAKES